MGVSKNIVVGAGTLYIANVGDALPTFNTTGGSVKTDFTNDANWRDLGYTTDGTEVSYEPTYSDVNVDQLKDAAKVFLEQETMRFSTSLTEATLENIILAMGRSNNSLVRTDVNNGTFSIGIGSDVACEYQLAVVGPAPGTVLDCETPANDVNVERIYVAYRVVSVEGSTHSLTRSGATMFPVTFRALPYDAAAAGEEYGKIVDREITTV